MDPTTRGAIHDGDRTTTRLTRRAANASALVVVAFWALFVFSAELPAGRAHSPWAEDPYDAVVSFAALLVPLVAVVTFVRCQRWRGVAPMPASAVRQVLRGVGVVLLAIGATVGADLAALLARARLETWGPWFGSLAGLLALTGALTLGAAALLALAWWRSRHYYLAGEAANPTGEDDALDDVLALSVDVGTSTGRRCPRLGEALVTRAQRADVALRSSRFSPRRHPWAFCFVVALISGVAFSTWHSLLEGLPTDPALALRVWLLYAGILTIGIVAGYTLLGRYLRLIRCERAGNGISSKFARGMGVS
jgi:hypothetical protein